MDYFLLLLVGKISKCTATHLRYLLGAAFGASMACVCIILTCIPGVMRIIIAYGFVGIVMLKICFKIKEFSKLYSATLYLYFFTFLYGGFFEWLKSQIPFFRRNGLTLLGLVSFGYFFCLFLLYVMNKIKGNGSQNIYQTTIYIGQEKIQVKALLDTGNSLMEPISKKPVSIINKSVMEVYLEELRQHGFRVIPFHSIGKEHGILEGYEVTQIIITKEERSIVISKGLLGIYEGRLSSSDEYQMILHPLWMKE